MQLKGKRALVTGAAVRLGRAIAEGLAARGAELCLHYNSHRREADQLANEIRDRGGHACTIQADLADPDMAEALALEAEEALGPIDLLVLSASTYPRESLESISADRFESTLRSNLISPFLLARRLGLKMKERGSGRIVTILDWSIDRPDPGYLPYQIAKAGLREATYGLARALSPEVNVNGVSPGAVLLPEGTSEDRRRRIRDVTPLGRIGRPEDVVAAVLFLLESGDFVTGSILKVDGGRSLR